MWVVRAKGVSLVASLSAWVRGGDGLFVYGSKPAAEAAAVRLGGALQWEVAELPALLVESCDELRETLRLLDAVVQQMREAGTVALWPASAPEDETIDDGDANHRGPVKLTN